MGEWDLCCTKSQGFEPNPRGADLPGPPPVASRLTAVDHCPKVQVMSEVQIRVGRGIKRFCSLVSPVPVIMGCYRASWGLRIVTSAPAILSSFPRPCPRSSLSTTFGMEMKPAKLMNLLLRTPVLCITF
jgi:hypothetical protein